MKMEAEEMCGPVLLGNYVFLFDGRDMTEREVQELIDSGRADESDDRIVKMSEKQYETVFRSLIAKEGTECPGCGRTHHMDGAEYCCSCGTKLEAQEFASEKGKG